MTLQAVQWSMREICGLATQSSVVVLAGTSDGAGNIKLSTSEEKVLHDAWNKKPNDLWLVHEGQAHQLVLSREREGWTDDQKMNEALDAMGYSDDLGTTGDKAVDDFHTRLARDETRARTGAAMLDKTKKNA